MWYASTFPTAGGTQSIWIWFSPGTLAVASMRMHQGRPVILFAEIASMNEAESLAGTELRIAESAGDNELLGRGGRLVQVGTRASRFDRAHWESTLGVRQFWADECRARPAETLDEVIAHLKRVGVTSVYFSNDIDGTDEAHADATGTPEPGGLDPEWVVALIRRLGREIGLLGGDVMEVAPPLRRRDDSETRTVALGVRYLRETIEAVLGEAI